MPLENQHGITKQQIVFVIRKDLRFTALDQREGDFATLVEEIILQRLYGIDILLIANQINSGPAGLLTHYGGGFRLVTQLGLNNSFQVFEFHLQQLRTVVRSETVLQVTDELPLTRVLRS